MAKAKRVKSGQGLASSHKWENGLLAANFDDEKWKANITFVVGNRPEDYTHIKALNSAIAAGSRKLFSVISQEELYKEVNELGNPKNKKTKDVPAHYEVCEACKLHLDINEDIPLPLLARLLKFKLLAIKTADVKRRDQEKKLSAEKDKAAKGGKEKGGKDRSKSPGKKGGGKKTPEPQSAKQGSKLKKRGEEDDKDKYIDDEPDDGAQHYIVINGFHNPNLFTQLSEININVDAIMRVSSQDYSVFDPKKKHDPDAPPPPEKDEKTLALEAAAKTEKKDLSKALNKFWKDVILLLQKHMDTCKLHDIAKLEYEVQSLIMPSNLDDPEQKLNFANTLFEDTAVMIYDLIDARRLYQTYLENLKLYHIPTFGPGGQTQDTQSTGSATPAMQPTAPFSAGHDGQYENLTMTDMRYYNDLMNCIPQESVSIPLVLHCMLEQICATDEGRDPPSEVQAPPRTDGLNSELAAHLSGVAFKLALTEEEHSVLAESFDMPNRPPDTPNQPLIINHNDDVTIRTHHLESVYGFNAMETEKSLLKLLPFAVLCNMARPTSSVARERAARLQELIHFCASSVLSVSEIDRAFKQFVFESMDLAVTDHNGFIMTRRQEGLEDSAIPWDDPYPFFKGMIPHHEKTQSPNILNVPSPSDDPRSGACSPTPDDKSVSLDLEIQDSNRIADTVDSSGHSRPSTADSKKGILRSGAHSASPSKQSRSNSVHFDVGGSFSGQQLTTGCEEGEKGVDEFVAEEEEEEEFMTEEKTLEESMMDIVESQKRNLDQWCFAEHYEPTNMLQVLKEASYSLPFLDSYYHKRDHSLLVCLHNPHNQEMKNHVDWHCEVHSNLGFRNYLEYVEDSISDWLKEKEAEYQAKILQHEVDKFRKDEENASKAADKAAKIEKRKLSPAKSRSRSPKGSRSSSRERSPSLNSNPYIRPGSLKAWKEEQDLLKAEEDEKEKHKSEKRVKSPKQRSKDDEKDEKDKKRPTSRNSAKSRASQSHKENHVGIALDEANFYKFYGYDVGNSLVHASGILTTMLPSDGGQIRMERTDFVQGTTSIKTSVLKDGHVFSVHLLNPSEVAESEPNTNESFENDDQVEKSELEKSEKEESKDYDEELAAIPQEQDSEEVVEEEKGKKALPLSAFGSITANLTDGMILSFSQFGAQGEAEEGKPYEPEVYIPPPVSHSPAPPQSPSKGKKDKAKGTPTPEPVEVPVDEEPHDDDKIEEEPLVEQPFQQLFVSCPDGLNVRFYLESSVGIKPNSPEDRRIVVKQSYPFKTKFVQPCEASRKKYALTENSRLITSEGTVIKNMVDGSIEVLYADGTVSRHTGAWPLPPSRVETPPRVSSGRSHEDKDRATPTKKGKSSKASARRDVSPEKPEIPPPTEEIDRGIWTTTYPNGETVTVNSNGSVKELKQVMICVASDPETKQSMSTRDDHVITVSYPEGTTIVEHSDGTRVTTYYRENRVTVNNGDADETGEDPQYERNIIKFIKIECPGMATVEFNCSTSENLTVFGNGTTINVFPDGFYALHHNEGGRIEIDTEGRLVYFPRPIKNMEQLMPERELQYVMRHNADIICETVDTDGNTFSVKYTGDFSITPPNVDEVASSESVDDFKVEKTVHLSHYMQHAPRFFIIHADGSGTELLRYQDVAEYLMAAEQSPSTAVMKDLLPNFPGVTGITILKPYLGGPSERWMKKYDLDSIIPRGIQSRDLTTLPPKEFKTPGPDFGTNVGQGLSVGAAVPKQTRIPIVKCPSILEIRQFVQYKPVTGALRSTLRSGLREYAEYVMTRNRAEKMMKITDPRTEEEKILAADLQHVMSPKKGDSMQFVPATHPEQTEDTLSQNDSGSNLLKADMKNLYEKATAPPVPTPPPTPTAKRTQADWERDQREVAEEKDGRDAIRYRKIPQYFDSELGKAFLLTQAKDVDQMMRELTEDPRRDGTEAIRGEKHTVNNLSYLEDSPLDRHINTSQPQGSAQSDRSSASASPAVSRNTKLPSETPVAYSGGFFSETPSGLRPGNPTPAHAAGQGSPAPVRPKNPTPAHATKVMEKDRPGNPTPQLAGGKDGSSAESETQRNGIPLIPEQPTEEQDFENQMFMEEYQGDENDQMYPRSLRMNVVGDPRIEHVPLPTSIMGGRPGAIPNNRFIQVEDPVRRRTKNSLLCGASEKGQMLLDQMRGLSLLPEEVNYGVLREGSTYAVTVYLKNTGVDTCRYKVKQPPPGTGLRVIYKPGPVAAGMNAELSLELYAIAVGVEGESGVGTINHELIIVTETDILRLPVTAIVLTGHDYDNRTMESPAGGKSPGTRLISTKPPSTTGIIRPRKEPMIGTR